MSVTEQYDRFALDADHDRLVSLLGTGATAVTGVHDPDSLVWGADLAGLAAALATTLDAPSFMAVAGDETPPPRGAGEPVHFPEPVGTRDARDVSSPLAGTRLAVAPGIPPWCALRVTGERTLAMVDDAAFASAVILAAASQLPPGAVWHHATEFLSEARRLGLRFAQAVIQ